MEFKKKSKASTEIPTASMPDIVFMLLLFFMVTTVFRQFSGLPVDLPSAQRIQKLDARANVVNLWASRDGELAVDDRILDEVTSLRHIMYDKMAENPLITTSLKIDRATNMRVVRDVHEELRHGGAYRVNYCAVTGR